MCELADLDDVAAKNKLRSQPASQSEKSSLHIVYAAKSGDNRVSPQKRGRRSRSSHDCKLFLRHKHSFCVGKQ